MNLRPSGSVQKGFHDCRDAAVSGLSWTLIVGGGLYLWRQTRTGARYGRYVEANSRCCPARLAWFLQEFPAFLLPLLLLLLGQRLLLLASFMLHYFHRSFIYAFLTRGRPVPLFIVLCSAIFCSLNGFLQAHYLLHCRRLEDTWLTDAHLAAGLLVFVVGMTINIHSDHILRSLRKPGETVYRIPHGGLFELVSGANFFGEIVQWCGFAVAAGSLPAFAFFFFTVCSIGPRAYQHHRYPQNPSQHQHRFRIIQ
uniref:3-oxo-5alpha-steroid 4-dehydrogenase (NADP(+)) n=1 Tax=Amphiprion percula TaxID=161767 RepID=A0A3P8TCB1_AMPPE